MQVPPPTSLDHGLPGAVAGGTNGHDVFRGLFGTFDTFSVALIVWALDSRLVSRAAVNASVALVLREPVLFLARGTKPS